MAPGSELGHAAPKARALSVFPWAALVREDSAFTVRWGCHWVLRFQQGRASCWAALCVLRPTENLSSFVPGQANSGLLTASRGFFPLASSFLCIRQTLEEDAPPPGCSQTRLLPSPVAPEGTLERQGGGKPTRPPRPWCARSSLCTQSLQLRTAVSPENYFERTTFIRKYI